MLHWIKKLFQKKCTCFHFVGLGRFETLRNAECPQHGDAASMNSGHCPDCQGTSFLFGPEGGVAQMVKCANEKCGSEYTVEVTNPDSDPVQIIFWGRVKE